jgi:hypothetical protein
VKTAARSLLIILLTEKSAVESAFLERFNPLNRSTTLRGPHRAEQAFSGLRQVAIDVRPLPLRSLIANWFLSGHALQPCRNMDIRTRLEPLASFAATFSIHFPSVP